MKILSLSAAVIVLAAPLLVVVRKAGALARPPHHSHRRENEVVGTTEYCKSSSEGNEEWFSGERNVDHTCLCSGDGSLHITDCQSEED